VTGGLIGTTLPGGVRVDAELARGGFGVVYRGHQLAIGRDVAVKVMPAALAPDSLEGRTFVQEIQAVGRLAHANVVRIYQADATVDGRLFFVMELLAGRDLEQEVAQRGPLSPARAVDLTRQLLAGLDAVHDAGLVHADLKPANAMIVDEPTGERLVLVDFGLARVRRPDGQARARGGTPAYMAPEQLASGRVDARSDLYAAALTLLTLLTGFRRTTVDLPSTALDGIADPHLREVLGQALARAPDDRFQSAAEFSTALSQLAAPPRGPDAGPPPPRRRRSALVGLLALATLAVSAVALTRRDRVATARPIVTVVGSDAVLHGVLAPAKVPIEHLARIELPLRAGQDQGSSGAVPALLAGSAQVGARSERFGGVVPQEVRTRDAVLIEVAIAHDQLALFVPRANPIEELDLAALQATLCCTSGDRGTTPRWPRLAPRAGRTDDVAWLLFKRRDAPRPGDTTSGTVRLADQWLCDPAQLCPSQLDYGGAFGDVLTTIARTPAGLGLSTQSYANSEVRAVPVVDRAHGRRLDGRRVLWLYVLVARAHPLPAATCRFLDAMLADTTAAALTAAGRATPLPPLARAAQRAWLGLDDRSCHRRRAGDLAGAAAVDIVRSPVGDQVERPPWVPIDGR
jgi:hypothetical protein